MNNRVCIIGGGVSGLFAGANLQNTKATIFERSRECGLKLLMSGSSKCNFTHEGSLQDFSEHYGNNKKITINALKRFSNIDILEYFDKKNYRYEMRDDGKYFPKSYSAKELRDFLIEENLSKNNSIKLNEQVEEIEILDKMFRVRTNKGTYNFEFVIVATGGKSYPITGSDGNFFPELNKIGHKIIPLRPALTPVYIKEFELSSLMGLSFENIKIENWRDGKKIGEYFGDILITHFGLSGPGILNNSRNFLGEDILKINFLGNISRKDIEDYIINYIIKNPKSLVISLIKSLNLQKRFCDEIIKLLGLNPSQKISDLTKIQRKKIVEKTVDFSFEIEKLGDYNIAMATAGGVDIKEISTKNFESKLIENLFIVGEALDIDGDTGGYNIQWAFTSGYLSATEVNKRANGIDN